MDRKRKSGTMSNTYNGTKKVKGNGQLRQTGCKRLQYPNLGDARCKRLQYPYLGDARKVKLNEIFEEIHTKVSIDNTLQEMKDIQAAVHKMLERVVNRVNERGVFKVSRIQLGGSMAEKTAVWKHKRWPVREIHTEFDYLGVLECSTDIIDRDQECGHCVGLSGLPINAKALHEYHNISVAEDDTCLKRARCDYLFWREINVSLGSACKCYVIEIDDYRSYWSLKYKLAAEFVEDDLCSKCAVETPTGILRVKDSVSVGKDGDIDCSLVFLWTSKANSLLAYDRTLQEEPAKISTLTIHVDFLPTIEILKSKLNDDACGHDFFIVPKRCNVFVCNRFEHWRKSNCMAEIAYIVHDMSEKHRKCCRLIKYCLSFFAENNYRNIDWYNVKTVALKHSRKCSDASEYRVECVLKILTKLKHAYQTKFLTPFHDSRVNICTWDDDWTVIRSAIERLCSVTNSESCRTFMQRL